MKIEDYIGNLQSNGWVLTSTTNENGLVKGVFNGDGGEVETYVAKNIDELWMTLHNSVYEGTEWVVPIDNVGNKKDYWYTLAHSKIATYKMCFSEKMTKEEATKLGESECARTNIKFVGTFSEEDITEKEMELRREM